MPSNFTFDIDQEQNRNEMLAYIKGHGLSSVDAAEVVKMATKIAYTIVNHPRYEKLPPAHKNKLPKAIVTILGPKFTEEERQVLKVNYPENGVIIPENYWNSHVREVLIKFANELSIVLTKWVNDFNQGATPETGTNTHYIVFEGRDTTQEDYEKVLVLLSNLDGVGIERYPNDRTKASVFYNTNSFRADLALITQPVTEAQQKLGVTPAKIKVASNQVDNVTMDLLKMLSQKLNFKIYSTSLNVFLPLNPNIFDIYNGLIKPEILQTIKNRNFEPLFFMRGTITCYAKKINTEEIHIINGTLLQYLILNPVDAVSSEFNYKVADSLLDFANKFDMGLIPTLFYKYFNKSTKIINWSDFDISSFDRKVFIRPYIFELHKLSQGFYTVAGPDGGAIAMTRVLPGETLDGVIKNFLKNELEIAEDYLGATIEPDMEFDLDKMNSLIPRLRMHVFIGEGVISEEQRNRLIKGWISKKASAEQKS